MNLASTLSSLVDLLPTSPISNLTTRKYALPDKAVASQVLMYRQLLHTSCKPGLRLSRGYEGTDAQRAVKHMPWWEHGVEQTRKMVISYDNLIVRLWVHGAILPFVKGGYAAEHSKWTLPKDLYDDALVQQSQDPTPLDVKIDGSVEEEERVNEEHIDTLINEQGLPPIPHPYWVDRLGFQQTDPVTDFRSGGVLSLAMLVHLVESCPDVHSRFLPTGDAHMLPFGITCINVTDMIAKFCMFSKSVDKMDALLSQKPFWRMFSDPNSLLVLQELAMDMLCDVVVELGRERKLAKEEGEESNRPVTMENTEVSVFDFAEIMSRTEQRVYDDLLCAGPKTVEELRSIHHRLRTKYLKNIERKEMQAQKRKQRQLKDAEIDPEAASTDFAMDLFKLNAKMPLGNFILRGQDKSRNQNASQVLTTEEVEFAIPKTSLKTPPRVYESGGRDVSSQVTESFNGVDLLIDDFVGVSIESFPSLENSLANTKRTETVHSFTIDDEEDLLS